MPDLPLILRGVPDPMIVIGADGLITDMNPAARGLFGDWALGRDHGAVLRQPPVLAAIAAVLAVVKGFAAQRLVGDGSPSLVK